MTRLQKLLKAFGTFAHPFASKLERKIYLWKHIGNLCKHSYSWSEYCIKCEYEEDDRINVWAAANPGFFQNQNCVEMDEMFHCKHGTWLIEEPCPDCAEENPEKYEQVLSLIHQ